MTRHSILPSLGAIAVLAMASSAAMTTPAPQLYHLEQRQQVLSQIWSAMKNSTGTESTCPFGKRSGIYFANIRTRQSMGPDRFHGLLDDNILAMVRDQWE
jgi:hypothetical protein